MKPSANRARWDSGREAVVSEEVSDGRQLTIVNMKQMTIEGEGNSRIVVEPRHAFCLRFVDCMQCTVKNLTIGHTNDGHCEGGVIGIKRGWRVFLFVISMAAAHMVWISMDRETSPCAVRRYTTAPTASCC